MAKKKSVALLGAGFIGSALYEYLKYLDYDLWAIDKLPYINDGSVTQGEHEYTTGTFLRRFDYIILTAGKSSVAQANNAGVFSTFEENVNKFVELCGKLGEDNKLIYISSGSVYGSTGSRPVSETHPLPLPSNIYDWSKQVLDKVAEGAAPNSVALRLGTVCGHSHNQRLDLMIPKMVYHAKVDKKIMVNNRESWRAILGMKDLCSAIQAILECKWQPGRYNLASFNMKIEKIAQEVSERLNVPIEELPDTSTYSFALGTSKFEASHNWAPQQRIGDIIDDCLNNVVPPKEELYKYERT